MILANVNSSVGLVNGCRGIATGVILEPDAEFFALDDIHILCAKPPRCVLFKRVSEHKTSFEHLDEGIIPVFPIERSLTINSYSIRRKQVPMCAAFSLTDYKVQGQAFTKAILDLKNGTGARGWDSHRKFCSRYIQLSRLTSFAGLHLLQKLEMSDLSV
jgi:hypothetical protein